MKIYLSIINQNETILSNIFYNSFIFCYQLLISFAGLFSDKASKMTTGRKDLLIRIRAGLIENKSPIVWFHCASLGEFEQGRPVMEAFKKDFPDYKILLTFFSPSGYEIRKNTDLAHFVYYLPFDTKSNAAAFIEIINPKLAIFVKYEFWKNLLHKLNEKHIPTYLISANFRANQIFFKSYGEFFKKALFYFDQIFVQNEKSINLLQSIGYINVTLAGDTRFDRVFQLSKNTNNLPVIEKFKSGKKLFVVGSAWKEDIEFLIPFFNLDLYAMKIVIAPHEINAGEIENWRKQLKNKSALYSKIKDCKFDSDDFDILFIDNIGMLSSIYKYSDYCWIGGSFGKGLHNILEAAAFGVPIFFGNKNYQKFHEAVELENLGGAFSIGVLDEFKNTMGKMYKDDAYYEKVCKSSSDFVKNSIGATEKIMNYIKIQTSK